MISKGQRYWAPTMGCSFVVKRVALDYAWADLAVTSKAPDDLVGACWTKRQPLREGAFPFPVELLGVVMGGAK